MQKEMINNILYIIDIIYYLKKILLQFHNDKKYNKLLMTYK